MHIACEKGHAAALKLLLLHGADVEAHVAPEDDPRTPLHLAAEYAHEECVSLMLEHGANVHVASRHDSIFRPLRPLTAPQTGPRPRDRRL